MNNEMFEKIAEEAYVDEMEKIAKSMDMDMDTDSVAKRMYEAKGKLNAQTFGGAVLGRVGANKMFGGKTNWLEGKLRTPRRRAIGKLTGLIGGAIIGSRRAKENAYSGYLRDSGVEGSTRKDARYFVDRDKRYRKSNKKAVKAATKMLKRNSRKNK